MPATPTAPLIDHIHLRVADVEASKLFYQAVLGALGRAQTLQEGAGFFHADGLFVDKADGAVTHVHVSLRAQDIDAVKAFHAAALIAGGRDLHAPAASDYTPGDYAASVLDPDGNHVGAVFHGEAPSA